MVFPKTYMSYASPTVLLSTSSTSSVDVTFSYVSNSGAVKAKTVTITSTAGTSVLLSDAQTADSTGILSGAVHVTSSGEVTVTSLQDVSYCADLALAHPVSALERSYYVITAAPSSGAKAQVTVTSMTSNNDVTVTFPDASTDYGVEASGGVYQITLGEGTSHVLPRP